MSNIFTDMPGVGFKFWGAGDKIDKINDIVVRGTGNFNWSFIFILAVVFFLYGYNIWKKNWDVVKAGFALYGVHWLYEIANAIIFKCSGAPLWAVSNDSTTFILLIGVSWELSMMFSLAGMITYMMLPADKNMRLFAKGKFKGIPVRLVVAIGMALFFSLFESFLAGVNDGNTFIWQYQWWGVIPVFITTYIPFFLAAVYVPALKHKTSIIVLASIWGLVAILLMVLIPCGVI